MRPRVLATYPHDARAFTQGLLLFEGKLFESTGLNGESTLRRVTLATGVVERSVALDSSFFGEGLERVDRRLIQLTWRSGVAIVYDLDTFAEQNRFMYQGEGWGLCFDGTDLVMSNGTNVLTFRDPTTFAVRREIPVRRGTDPVANLNELECVGSLVYANVWQTDTIVRIDKATGAVLTDIDASGLLTPSEAQAANVLNGIAYDAATQHFYLTGKLWPKLFEVSFDFDPGGNSDAGPGAPDAAADARDAGPAAPEAGADARDAGYGARDAAPDVPRPDAGRGDATTGVPDARSPSDASSDRGDAGAPTNDAPTSPDAPGSEPPDAGPRDAGPGGGPPGDPEINPKACNCRIGQPPPSSGWMGALTAGLASWCAASRRRSRRRKVTTFLRSRTF